MSRPFRAVAAALALCASMIPSSGSASDPGSCGGSWTGSKSCTFRFHGFPILMRADAVGAGAHVRIWVSPAGSPEAPLLVCDTAIPPGQGGSTVSTDDCRLDEFPASKEDVPPPLRSFPLPQFTQTTRLQCNVQGSPGGTYTCSAGQQS